VGVTGDFRLLDDLQRKIATVQGPPFRLGLSKNLAEEARTQVLFGFQRGVDPYDRPWKKVWRDGQPLRDTGRLQNSITGDPSVSEGSFTISTRVKYAATHQYGATITAKNPTYSFGGAGSDGADTVTAGKPMLRFRIGRGRNARWVSKEKVTIPQRQFKPEGTVGPRWAAAFRAVADLFVSKTMAGGR
jgi:phage gpG-like protein